MARKTARHFLEGKLGLLCPSVAFTNLVLDHGVILSMSQFSHQDSSVSVQPNIDKPELIR